MELTVIKSGGNITHIALSGKLDVDGEAQIGDRFRELVASYKTPFIVDMSQVSYLASLGIRLLFSAAKSLAEQGAKMVVLRPPPMVEETLMTSGTAKFIPIARTEQEALGLL